MRSASDIHDRLEELRRIERSCDCYDPYTKRLRGEIDALEWILNDVEPESYDHVLVAD